MKKSKIMILLLAMVMILAISAVSAAEDIGTSDADLQAVDEAPIEEVASQDVDPIAATDDADVVAESGEGNNFTSLQTLIENNYNKGIVQLEKDYTRAEGDDVISITRSIAIMTKGSTSYLIDANNLGGIFKISPNATVYYQRLR